MDLLVTDPEGMAHIDATMAAYDDATSPCVVPVYALNDEYVVTAAGSAVFLQPQVDRFVLLTAGPLFDNKPFSPPLTWGGSTIGFIPLRGRAISTGPCYPNRKQDRIDLAALDLDGKTVDALRQTDARFAPGSVLRFDGTPDGFYSFMGYPEALNEPLPHWDGERTTYTVQRHIVSFRVQ